MNNGKHMSSATLTAGVLGAVVGSAAAMTLANKKARETIALNVKNATLQAKNTLHKMTKNADEAGDKLKEGLKQAQKSAVKN
jgi:gas vesicle protein